MRDRARKSLGEEPCRKPDVDNPFVVRQLRTQDLPQESGVETLMNQTVVV